MRIDNYSYRPTFQKLYMDEDTVKYIAQNSPKEDLPDIASACDLLQNSSRNFYFDSSTGKLVANISEDRLQGEHLIARMAEGKFRFLVAERHGNMHPRTYWKEAYKSIGVIFEECLIYLEDRNFVVQKTNRNIKNTIDYSKKFEQYI